jgi:hypothetical protein
MESFEFIDFQNFDIVKKHITNFSKLSNINKSFIAIDILDDKELNEIKEVFKIDEKIERFIKFNLEKWYEDIKNTFESANDIWKQFMNDFKRSIILCNGNKIDTPFRIMDYFDFKNTKNIENILMTCTQATLGFAFEVIHYDLRNYKDIHLAELSYQTKNDDSNLKINFDITDEETKFIIEKKLRIFKIVDGDDHTISIVTILIEFKVGDEFGLLNILYIPV